MGRRGIAEGVGEAFLVVELDRMKETVESLAANPALRRQMGAAGRRLVEDAYSAGRAARRIVDLVESLGALT